MEKDERKDIFYSDSFERGDNVLKRLLWNLFDVIDSPCRMLIEVFLREDFGERYFRFAGAVSFTLILALWPYFTHVFSPMRIFFSMHGDEDGIRWSSYITWYIYLALFMVACIRHRAAMKRTPGVFDFARYSKSRGSFNPTVLRLWDNENIGGRIRTIIQNLTGHEANIRTFTCWIEPAPFFLGGFVLAYAGQNLGWLLMVSAAAYSASYCQAYKNGDDFVMDRIDEMIIGEDHARTFMGDDTDGGRGYRFLGRRPNDLEKRQAVLDMMTKRERDLPVAK